MITETMKLCMNCSTWWNRDTGEVFVCFPCELHKPEPVCKCRFAGPITHTFGCEIHENRRTEADGTIVITYAKIRTPIEGVRGVMATSD